MYISASVKTSFKPGDLVVWAASASTVYMVIAYTDLHHCKLLHPDGGILGVSDFWLSRITFS